MLKNLLTTYDFKSAGTPGGRLLFWTPGGDCSFLPLGVSTDLQSVVKKCPNLFVFWGFVIPSYQYCHSDGFAIPINK